MHAGETYKCNVFGSVNNHLTEISTNEAISHTGQYYGKTCMIMLTCTKVIVTC